MQVPQFMIFLKILRIINYFSKQKIFQWLILKLKSCTLDDLILENNIDIKKYNHWVIDVQGAELEVLKGSIESIKLCNSITVEVSTENFYVESKFNEVKELLNKFNFKIKKDPKRNHEDVVFIRNEIN